MQVVWSPRALLDRHSQLAFVARDSARAAVALGDRIREAVAQLASYPELGRIGRRRGTRELVISGTPFLAIYRVGPKRRRVEIIRFLHGAQRWPPRSVKR